MESMGVLSAKMVFEELSIFRVLLNNARNLMIVRKILNSLKEPFTPKVNYQC